MSVFYIEGRGWVSKFQTRGKQRWTRGGPWDTREQAQEAEDRYRQRLTQGKAQAEERRQAAQHALHTVYLLYAEDRLIYVGLTGAGVRRFSEHRLLRAWWPEITRAEFEHIKGYEPARAREAELIRELLPPGNGNGKRRSTARPGRPLPPIPLGSGR